MMAQRWGPATVTGLEPVIGFHRALFFVKEVLFETWSRGSRRQGR